MKISLLYNFFASAFFSWIAMVCWTTPDTITELFFFLISFTATTVALVVIEKLMPDVKKSKWLWKNVGVVYFSRNRYFRFVHSLPCQ